jgi:hypothetical protein
LESNKKVNLKVAFNQIKKGERRTDKDIYKSMVALVSFFLLSKCLFIVAFSILV